MGDSRGHWEGDTLVVDTTNFTDKTAFQGTGENLHVIERFTRVEPNTLLYKFTIDDPSTFIRPWTAELPFVTASGPAYEFACHEGNYARRRRSRKKVKMDVTRLVTHSLRNRTTSTEP
jgi:hypothetical protein